MLPILFQSSKGEVLLPEIGDRPDYTIKRFSWGNHALLLLKLFGLPPDILFVQKLCVVPAGHEPEVNRLPLQLLHCF